MKISIITLFPKMISGFFDESIVKRAQEKKLVELEIINLRDFAVDSYGTVDDRPYGGGAGMVMKIEPILTALEKIKNLPAGRQVKIQNSKSKDSNMKIVLTSAKGKVFNQEKASELAKLEHLVLIAGHYEGVDERIISQVDEEISLGDFVMTGGEITAAAIADAIVRLLPGVLKKETATAIESFFTVKITDLEKIIPDDELLQKIKSKEVKEIQLLEFPHYTRPENFNGQKVPEVLLSGNEKKIWEWRMGKAWEETVKKRKDLLDKFLK